MSTTEAFQIPPKAKGIILDHKGAQPRYGEIDIPPLQAGDILVKVHAAPINPSDQLFVQGTYPAQKPFPCFAGFEGSGRIVAAVGEKEQQLIGKEVGFTAKQNSHFGSYADYSVTTLKQIMILPKEVDLDHGACSFVNPFTVAAMLEIAKQKGVKTVIHDIGASQLGKQMQRYFNDNGVNVINIVRRDEQAKDIKENCGAKYVLNQNEENFWQKLHDLSVELDAKIVYDAIGGEFVSNLIKHLPKNIIIYNYGLLSNEYYPQVDLTKMLFEGKQLAGFILGLVLQDFGLETVQKIASNVSKYLNTIFSSDISKKFNHNQFSEAFQHYEKNMSAGKVLIMPQ
ncbi:GroES (chaperonin 10)-like protein [Pseudocohnilembus persalinus]|uniref:GroES (Chaperonin 10)-like protein n=1 Tax=Pseudocohnilembus persalinus TaxID=266149 RepID=A0A0V0QS54_PSEPJ|nr:GroES (chaperonin 10)-like protein [Pseudocohnilembus persalinus]|eukprot:KRX05068.1 GroES (chaperonin 10)-like protein [Pseudocohnilembus persalinus]